jgi:hypothetical protein
MSITTVKNNMYHSYSSCGLLESDLSQLIDILNNVEDSEAYIVSEHISTIDHTINTVKRNFEQMLELNKIELHIFFSEFNSKTEDMIKEIDKLSDDLDRLSSMADELYRRESTDTFLEYFLNVDSLNADSLREFIPDIISVKNELEIFKMMIDTNNNKLVVGVRR